MLITVDQEYLKTDTAFSACGSGLLTPQWGLTCDSGCNSDCDCGCFTGDCGCQDCCDNGC